ncbi:DNA repair protein recA homolog 2, mitochondrial isoform X2 [Humulus lupulus]|uniref:DNA repair protein recA homolog 2, mitochondrial isoform X2 n=1 Tax=Humulus lupulus TaxID=3486 RepID=UPI002B412A95|nr:DNA repair protein recA homolog 2, mitochondrial isoform X2 [Humulus lupulus]
MIFLSAFALPVTHRLPFRGFPGTSVSSLLSSVLKKGGRHAIDSFGKNHCSFSSSVEISEFEYDGFHDDGKSTEKDAALHLALSQLSGEFDRESPLSLRRFFGIRRVPVISTGSLKLDLALGIGGLPKGRFVEIYGLEASGKTTLALHIIKEAQKVGGVCAYFDVENAIDPFLAESMGVDTQSLLISHPNSAENLLSAVDTLTKSGSVDVIVVDSVAALVPQCEIDVSLGGVRKDEQSRIMTQALRKIQYSLCNSQTLIVFVNQVRFGSKSSEGIEYIDEYTCGGNALKFYAAIRLRLKKTGLRETENKVTGLGISVQVVKNKLAPAMKKAELRLQFGRGFCCESEVLELACKHGVIVKEGNNYLIEGKVFSNEHAAEKHLAENDVIFDKLVSILRRLLFETK